MRIAVVGAGGVGGYFGTRLAEAGNDVTFVARGQHLEAIRKRGSLLVHSPLGEFHAPAGAFVATIAELEPVDVVLVAVKLWDTDGVARHLRRLTDAGARVISLQNGVQKDQTLCRHLPAEAVLGGVCYISAVIEEPGVVTHRGTLQRIAFGCYGAEGADVVEEFLDTCLEAGLEAEASDDIERVIWEKFIFLVGLSAATTLVRQPIGVIRGNAASRSLLHDVMAEAVAVGRASGVRLDPGLADQQLAFCDTLPEAMTSSMHNDLQQGRRLELPWLSGAIAELAKKQGRPAPRNQTVADALAPYVLGSPTAEA